MPVIYTHMAVPIFYDKIPTEIDFHNMTYVTIRISSLGV